MPPFWMSCAAKTLSKHPRRRRRGAPHPHNIAAHAMLTLRRGAALQTLQKAVEEFVRHVGQVKGLAPSVIDNAGGKICTFGSYRLGVYGPGMCLPYSAHIYQCPRLTIRRSNRLRY